MPFAVAQKPLSYKARQRKRDHSDVALKGVRSSPVTFIQLKEICPCDGGCPSCAPLIQPKLTISQPNDKYEQVADRVADQVMMMEEPEYPEKEEEKEGLVQTTPLADQITPLVQRQVEPEEEEKPIPEEEEVEPIQTKSNPGKTPVVAPSLASRINSLKGGGQPLSNSACKYFEPRFGTDFSHVRIHTDNQASETSKSINAKAFTTGKDIVFNSGQYSPETHSGKKLLAHELTHVVQQNKMFKKTFIQRRVRTKFVSCRRPRPAITAITGKNPVDTIRAADKRAIEMADEVLEELKYIRKRIKAGEKPNWPLISDGISIPLKKRFRLNPDNRRIWAKTGPRTVAMLIKRLQSVRNLLNGGWIRYTCLGPARVNTRSCKGPCCSVGQECSCKGTYRIWLCREFWKKTTDEKAIDLLHEAFHIYFGWPNHPGRLTNACCLSMFLGYYFNVPITSGCPGVCS